MSQANGSLLRILLIAPEPFYQDRGTPIAVKHVLEALSELNYHVDVLTYPLGTSPEIRNVQYIRVRDPLRFREVPIGFSWRKVWLDMLLYLALRRRLRTHRYVAIHAVEEAGFLAVAAARRYGIPVVYDMQSSLAEQMAARPLLRSRAARRIIFWCEAWLIRRAHRIVCSAGLAARVRRVAPQAQVQEWRYPSPHVPAAQEATGDLRRQLDIDGRPVVVYTGNFEHYQGVALLAQAMSIVCRRIPEAVFVLVGVHDGLRTRLMQRLNKTMPAGSYRLVARQSRERMPAYLAMADVLVSPRKTGSNLPLKVLDYLAAGRAIVATDIHAHRSVLDDSLALLTPAAPDAFADAIVHVLTDGACRARLEASARAFSDEHLNWLAFVRGVGQIYLELFRSGFGPALPIPVFERVSIVIPARNAAGTIGRTIAAARREELPGIAMEIIVADDGSTDDTAELASAAGARVVRRPAGGAGNPGAARNLGAAHATGDPIIFLDADCAPRSGWLSALLDGHRRGRTCVGGSLACPREAVLTARIDYYASAYHVHPGRRGGWVPNHTPSNISVRRHAWLETAGFSEALPVANGHEELAWQAQLRDLGQRVYFEPAAVVEHWYRPGIASLLERSCRWAYSAMESKAKSHVARWAWLYEHPVALGVIIIPLAPAQALYILGCWLAAGQWEALLAFPVILLTRVVYSVAMAVGGWQWWLRRTVSA